MASSFSCGIRGPVSGGGVRPRGICIPRGQAVPNELGGTQSCLRKPPGRLVPNQSKGSRSNSGKRAMVAATEADSSRATCAERTPTVRAGSPIPARKHARRWQTSPGSGSIADGPQNQCQFPCEDDDSGLRSTRPFEPVDRGGSPFAVSLRCSAIFNSDIPGLAAWTLAYDAPPTNWFGTAMPIQDRLRSRRRCSR